MVKRKFLGDTMKDRVIFRQIGLAAVIVLLTACHASKSHQQDFARGSAYSASNGQGLQQAVETSGLGVDDAFPGGDAGKVDPTTGKKFNTVYFGFDQYSVNKEYMDMIHANANYLKAHPKARMRIEGHTDPRGSREYNIGLGQRRGNSVEEVLEMIGVSKHQLVIVSYGKEKLAVPGETDEDYKLDRRVEMVYEQT